MPYIKWESVKELKVIAIIASTIFVSIKWESVKELKVKYCLVQLSHAQKVRIR